MHKFQPPTWTRPLKDPLARSISAEFGRRIVALRLEMRISRRVVAERTRIHWKKIRQMEEGWAVANLVEVARLADLYQVTRAALVDGVVGEAKRGRTTLRSTRKKCLCERLGEDGRAALRAVARKLVPDVKRTQRHDWRKKRRKR